MGLLFTRLIGRDAPFSGETDQAMIRAIGKINIMTEF